MKEKFIFIFLISLSFFPKKGHGQTVFWIESFGLGCSQGAIANSAPTPSNGLWSIVNTGVQGPQSNEWFISSTEAGLPVGQCGDGCLGTPGLTNKTLHISSNIAPPNTDPSAVYLQNVNSATDKRVQSPVIDCSLQTSIVFSFNYLTKGIPGTDFAQALYYDGSTWIVLGVLAPSTGTCAPKGLWASQTYTLPVNANGNPNIKIGFRWENGNAVGSGNISVAIDEITLLGTLSTSIEKRNSNKEMVIKLFPNPVKEKLILECENNIANKISITNSLGQLVYPLNNPVSKHEIDLSTFPSGVYFLKAEGDGVSKFFKILKE